jgi:tRNA-Thr(GGU) m(6)t(6)A37 methyltransferase TsaA
MRSQKDSFSFTPIAFLSSVFDHKFGTPRQGGLAPNSRASLTLERRWRDKGMLDSLQGFSHVWLVSVFHQNRNLNFPSKIHPPRLEGKTVGVLASRSPHRPNPVGLTLAKIERVEGDTLWVSGVDLVEGTPILDIKPYLAEADRPAEYSSGWAERAAETQVPCAFAPEADAQVDELVRAGKITERDRFVNLAKEVLALDPRPLSYRARVDETFAVVLDGVDVHARYAAGAFTVVAVKPFSAGDNKAANSIQEK